MPRNYKSTAVLLRPDPKFGSMLATKIINKLMLQGKKTIAQEIFYDAIEMAQKRLPDVQDPVEIFTKAIDNVKPGVEVRSKRVGGANYQVPREVKRARQQSLAIRWVPVTAASRIEAVERGQIDLECGSTTNNLERQKRVAFSPTTFVSGTKLMVKRGSPVRSFRDLAGKRVAVTSGTTNEKTLHELNAKFKLGMAIVASPEHAQSFELVAKGQAEAFATDDVLLYGLIAQRGAKADFMVLGDFLSYDPYGIMFRKDDPQLAKVVQDAFQILAEDGEIERQYKRWFLRRLPGGTSIDLPMSAQLVSIIESMAAKTEK